MLPEHQDIIDDRKDAGQHDEQQVSGQWRAKDRALSANAFVTGSAAILIRKAIDNRRCAVRVEISSL